jgi:hypothetical protein
LTKTKQLKSQKSQEVGLSKDLSNPNWLVQGTYETLLLKKQAMAHGYLTMFSKSFPAHLRRSKRIIWVIYGCIVINRHQSIHLDKLQKLLFQSIFEGAEFQKQH